MANMMGRKMGQIMIICLMAIMSTSSSALGDTKSIADGLEPLTNDEDNKSPSKKAYTYVSEYKRLPVFNFGIGKRWTDVNGIKGAQPYSFGFGKRSAFANFYPARMSPDSMNYDNYDNYVNDKISIDTRNQMKRSGRLRQYDFGLGKRSVSSKFVTNNLVDNHEDIEGNIRKHHNDELERRFIYGLSNRFDDDQADVQEDN